MRALKKKIEKEKRRGPRTCFLQLGMTMPCPGGTNDWGMQEEEIPLKEAKAAINRKKLLSVKGLKYFLGKRYLYQRFNSVSYNCDNVETTFMPNKNKISKYIKVMIK